MLLYLFFAFWEIVLRLFLTVIVFWMNAFRATVIVSIPIIILFLSMVIVAKIAFKLTHVKCDENRSVDEIVCNRGFRLESHSVQTSDGYILTLYHIINPYLPREQVKKKPVLLMHGMGTHGFFWLLNDELGSDWRQLIDPKDPRYDSKSNGGSHDSLGFELARRGYDVWIGNQRGNRFSQRHVLLSKNDSNFWNFSMDEIALFDLPALIHYILSMTKNETLAYVGFSQGANLMLALMSSQPKYNEVVKPFICMSPVVKTSHSKFVMGFGRTIINWAPYLATKFPGCLYPGFLEFLIQLFFCNHSLESFSNTIGKSFYSGKYVNSKRVSTFLAFPGVHASRKNATQYLQFASGPFARFDYGKSKNLEVYGRKTPPVYDLSKITNQYLALIYSLDDTCASAQDVRFLRSQLQINPLDVYVVRKKKWDHQDFQLGKDCGSVVNERILLILKVVMEDKIQSKNKTSSSLAFTQDEEAFVSLPSKFPSSSPSTSSVNFLSLNEDQKPEEGDPSKIRSTSNSSVDSSSNSACSSSFEFVGNEGENVSSTVPEDMSLRKRK